MALAAFAVPANAGTVTTPIDLSGSVTGSLTTFTNGDQYPQNGGTVTVGGVNFILPTCSNGQCFDLSGHQTSALDGKTGVIGSFANDPAHPQQVVVDVSALNIVGATTVYTLANTAFSASNIPPQDLLGKVIGDITFVGLHSTYTYNFVEGQNIRDHLQGGFVNTATDVVATATFQNGVASPAPAGQENDPGTVRLDMQKILLPSEFLTDTLVDIIYDTVNVSDIGQPQLVSAVSIETSENGPGQTPVPPAWTLMVSGLFGLGLFARHRSTKTSRTA
jgi:hypothetical protein